jgi:hypothetical protein
MIHNEIKSNNERILRRKPSQAGKQTDDITSTINPRKRIKILVRGWSNIVNALKTIEILSLAQKGRGSTTRTVLVVGSPDRYVGLVLVSYYRRQLEVPSPEQQVCRLLYYFNEYYVVLYHAKRSTYIERERESASY